MPLEIRLERPSATFNPGATIKGVVRLKSLQDQAIQTVGIKFSGRCKVKIIVRGGDSSDTHRSRGYYFLLKHPTLYKGKYKHKAGVHDWPFQFEIPTEAAGENAAYTDGDQFVSEPNFRGSGDVHQIPASFNFDSSSGTANHTFEARVEYVLHAILTRPPEAQGIFSSNMLEVDLPLRIITQRPRFQARIKTIGSVFRISTLRLVPGKEHAKLGFRERASSIVKSSRLPSVLLQAIVELPNVIEAKVKQEFPVYISFYRQTKAQAKRCDIQDIPAPIVRINHLELKIKSTTMVRDENKPGWRQRTANGHVKTVVFSKYIDIPVPSVDSDTIVVRGSHLGAEFDLTRLMGISIAMKALPTFKTYNICHHHHMRVLLEGECCGEKIELEHEFPFTIMPEIYDARAEQPPPDPPSDDLIEYVAPPSIDGDGPPSYESVMRNNG